MQPGNTFDAHRLLHLAREHGLQDALKKRLFDAYFCEAAAIGDPDSLARFAVEVGLPQADVREVLTQLVSEFEPTSHPEWIRWIDDLQSEHRESFSIPSGSELTTQYAEGRIAALAGRDAVVVTGYGLSETRDGGYAQYSRVEADLVVPLPKGLSMEQAMALGTAGFTAGLAVHRLEQNGLKPDQGRVVVTGATGGVGSLITNMLGGRGYNVTAVTGKPQQQP